MVLQRDVPLTLWGWADPGEDIQVLFKNQRLSTTADSSGSWFISLASEEAGGPYDMVISGKNSIRLENVMVGEVWVCSGQSNMEWKLGWLKDTYADDIANSSNKKIRLLQVKKKIAAEPEKDVVTDGWEMADSSTVAQFSAVGYFFGRELFQHYKVPIGLILSEWGGTVAEAWTSKETLRTFPEFQDQVETMNNQRQNEAFREYENQLEEWNKNLKNVEKLHNSGKRSWYHPKFSDANWKMMKVPGSFESEIDPAFDGVVWFRKEVNIPKNLAGKDLILSLGPIDDIDSTWFNGELIGTTSQYNTPRKYVVPAKKVKKGKNRIAVRVADIGGGGGFLGEPKEMQLIAGTEEINLSGDWKYQVAVNMNHLPPQPKNPINHNNPMVLFNGMISPLIPFAIKGVIWYQGESNAPRAKQYKRLFPALISNWRSHWQRGPFPFLFVQLANFREPKDLPGESSWAELREAQLHTLSLPNTGMAVAIDIGEADNIHPKNKLDVGKRLALAARKVAYGEDIVFSGPLYDSMAIEDNKVRIKFNHTGSGLMVKDQGELKEFSIAGADKKFYPAKAIIENDEIIVESEEVKEPVAVRYAWADNPANANLYNKEGLPASPFRTDNWEGITK